MAGRYRKKRSAAEVFAGIFAAAALLLAVLAAILGFGRAYCLRVRIDVSQMSPTLQGALIRDELLSPEELEALGMDNEFALKELFTEDGTVGEGVSTLRRLSDTMDEATAYLRGYDASGVAWRDPGIDGLLARLNVLRKALTVLAAAVCLLLLAAVIALLRGRRRAVGVYCASAALLTGATPLLLLCSVRWLAGRMQGSLDVLAHYGVGLNASLTLTRSGMAQVLLAAAALMLCACGWMAAGLAGGRRRRAS